MLPERIDLLIDKGECWIWRGAIEVKGYGRVRHDGIRYRAHRFVYERLIGPIGEGLTLDHLCRNRACVKPDHLEAVPIRTNVLRGIGRSANNARKTHCFRGHAFDGGNTYIDPSGRRRCRACHRWPYRDSTLERSA